MCECSLIIKYLKLSSLKKVKKITLLIAFISVTFFVSAQNNLQVNYNIKIETIPAFNIHTIPDSSNYSNNNIKKNKPFIIMFFSPDCEHCQKELKELSKNKNKFKNIPILMISPANYAEIKQFYKDYAVAKMPNITVAHDDNSTMSRLFQLRTFPTMFVYNRTGKMVKTFVSNVSIPDILQAVK